MKRGINAEVLLGIGIVAIGLLVMLVWVPLDTETGIIEKVRSRREVGDAMAPTIAAALFAFAGLLLCLSAWRRESDLEFGGHTAVHLLAILAIVAVSFACMRWTGPAIVALAGLFDPDLPTYRNLRDTVPWKYLGYLVGGTMLVFGLISYVEHRFRWRNLVIALVAAVALALLYDLPFDDLLLPPNGDV